ncbi:MAG: HAD-IA family hydrolase [Chthoniobacteraceae bacterium]
MKPESSSADASASGKRQVDVIFFDAAGTLIHLPESVGFHYSLVAKRHGLHLDETRTNEAFRSAWKQMPARETTRKPRPDDDKGWWRTLVAQVLEISAENQHAYDFNAYFEDLYLHFAQPGVWQLYSEVYPTLANLHQPYRLAVVSNFDRRLLPIFDHLGITSMFEKIILSSEVGADKPDPCIFQYALDSLHVTPSRTLYIGDDPAKDWRAAKAAGMHVFHLDRPQNSLADIPALLEKLNAAVT